MQPTAPPRFRPPSPGAALAVALVAIAASLAAVPAAGAAAAERPAGERTAPAAGRDADPAERMWWNRERMVAGLALSPEQRGSMDERLHVRLAERREQLVRYGELRGEMAEALAAGDWPAAEEKSAEANAAMAAADGAESALVIDVMKILSPTQRQRMSDENPYLMRRPWLVGGIGRALRRGRRAAAGEGS